MKVEFELVHFSCSAYYNFLRGALNSLSKNGKGTVKIKHLLTV